MMEINQVEILNLCKKGLVTLRTNIAADIPYC